MTSETMGPVLEVSGLTFAYPDGTEALYGVGFSVSPGERVGLVGPNGAGKSTLIQHLNGFLRGSGTVRLSGVELSRRTLREARRRVGVVFQDPDDQLFMPTVRDDIAFGPLNLGLGPDETAARVDRVLAAVGMSDRASRAPHRLSAGEKRAVAIASVLVMEPDVLVLDEPSAHLDPRGRRRLIRLLSSLPMALLVASHDLELILDVCPRTLLLDSGRLVTDGETRELFSDRALMEAHGLERPHSLLAAEAHHHDHDRA